VTITPEQIKAARRLLGWTCVDLALNSPVGVAMIHKIESKLPGKRYAAILALQRALEAAGVIFVDENGEGPGVRLRRMPKP
jgi:hypothetical protein